MKSIKIGLDYIFPILAMVYIATMGYTPYPGHPVIKALPILFLGGLVLWNYSKNGFNSKSHLMFAIGFLFSAGGDVALAIPFSQSFVIGLGLFLVAHIFYIIGFYSFPRESFSNRKMVVYGFLIFGFSMGFFILPNTGELLLPVGIYLTIITTMACFAGLQKYSFMALLLGGLLFMISDGVIAVNKFLTPVPNASLWIMATYYTAQGFLARGILGIIPGVK